MLKDETGNRYGKLTVKEYSHTNKKEGAYWLCVCDCGETSVVLGCVLRRGHAKSCGCSVKKVEGEANFLATLRSYKRHASDRGYLFELTEEESKAIMEKDCHYCGQPPSNITNHPRSNGAFVYNGLDRIDNNIDYTVDNIVPCCKYCNAAKSDRSYDDFISWILKSYHHITGDII